MSKITRKIEGLISRIPEKCKNAKLIYSENKAIKRKKNIYKEVCWSQSQQNEFDSFWASNYGGKISNAWARLYEAANGVYHYDYFPEKLYTTKLEKALNKSEYCTIFNNKSLIEFIYGNVEGVRVPKTYLTCCNGNYRNAEQQLLTRNEAEKYCEDLGECIIKPTVETGSGKNIAVMNLQQGFDTSRDGYDVSKVFDDLGEDFIIQEKLSASKEFSVIYPNSINTIRLITYLVDNEVHNAAPVMRIGVAGNKVDNIHMGGLCVGVNEDGTLKQYAYQLGYGDKTIRYEIHPDTGIKFDGYKIGDIEKVIEVAKRLHTRSPHLGIFSWDLTIDANDEIVLIEANCKDQSVWFPQIVDECPLFGDDTAYMLNKIRKAKK